MLNYESGINLYRAFKSCLIEAQDKPRLLRLESRLDTYYQKLTDTQKTEFGMILIKQGLITGTLAKVIETFAGRVTKISEAR